MKKKYSTVLLAETGIAVALALILDFIKIWRAPQGGSVNLAAVPIIILAFRWGFIPTLIAGGLLGTLKLFLGGYAIHPLQAILDYPLAFLLLGTAGAFQGLYRKSGNSWWVVALATLVGFLGRFVCHFITGILFFSQYAPENMSATWYTVVYNGTHLVPMALLTIIISLALLRYPSIRGD